MKTLPELLDALNKRTGLSDRKLGPVLGLGEGAATQWRTGRTVPSEETAQRMAELLGLEPAYVVAICRATIAKTDVSREMWQRVRDAFGKAAMLALLSAAPFVAPSPASAGFDISTTQYTLRRNRRGRSRFAAAIAALLTLTGCSGMFIDSHTPAPADWPELRVIEHRVSRDEMAERCSKYVPWYSSVEACAEWHFARGECHVWITPDSMRFVVEHELMHCRGLDHPGDSTARDAWHAFSATIAGRALADSIRARQ